MSNCPDSIDFRIYCQWCFVQAHQNDPNRTCRDCREKLAKDPQREIDRLNELLKQSQELLVAANNRDSSDDNASQTSSDDGSAEPNIDMLNLLNDLEGQRDQIKLMHDRYTAMKDEFTKTIGIQNQLIEELSKQNNHAKPSEDVAALNSIIDSIQSKTVVETSASVSEVKSEIDQLKSLVMASETDEEIKNQVLARAERLVDLKKSSSKPSRLEELAKPKKLPVKSKQPSNGARK